MKQTIPFILGLMFLSSNAQKNSVYAELFGNGLLGSLNYERQITKKPKLLVRCGLGFWSNLGFLGSNQSGYTIPTSIHYLINLENDNYLDFGIGATLVKSNFKKDMGPELITYLFTTIGFRRNFGNSLFWRVHITPFFDNITKNTVNESMDGSIVSVKRFDVEMKQWFGISFGKQF